MQENDAPQSGTGTTIIALKPSQYNAQVTNSAGEALWYNTASGTRLVLSASQQRQMLQYIQTPSLLAQALAQPTHGQSHAVEPSHRQCGEHPQQSLAPPESRPLLQDQSKPIRVHEDQLPRALLDTGFFVPEHTNEVQWVLERLQRERRQAHTVSLTVSLTSDCNLACPYCVISTTCGRGAMSEETQDMLLRWWEQQLVGRSACSIEWMGGEPLLYPETIQRLGSGLLERASRAGVQVAWHSVTTNGTLLSDATIAVLQSLGVQHLQVTLDGPPAVHDQSRPALDGKGSYTSIIEGLHRVAGKFRIALRINVQVENQAFLLNLLDCLATEQLQSHIVVYPARVYPPPVKAGCGSSCGLLSQEQFASIATHVSVGLLERGFRLGEQPEVRAGGYCGAYQRSYYVVGPDGRLYRCPARVGQEEGVIGSVTLEAPTPVMDLRDQAYQSLGPTRAKGCLSCKVLPLCMGGCPEEGRVTGKVRDECSPWRFRLHQQLIIEQECDNA